MVRPKNATISVQRLAKCLLRIRQPLLNEQRSGQQTPGLQGQHTFRRHVSCGNLNDLARQRFFATIVIPALQRACQMNHGFERRRILPAENALLIRQHRALLRFRRHQISEAQFAPGDQLARGQRLAVIRSQQRHLCLQRGRRQIMGTRVQPQIHIGPRHHLHHLRLHLRVPTQP